MASRPSTPYYFYNDLDQQHDAASSTGTGTSDETEDTESSLGSSTLFFQDQDPPPSYTSSSDSSSLPSSSLSSPRSSSSLSHSSRPRSGTTTTTTTNNAQAATVIDMGPLHMTPATHVAHPAGDLRNRSTAASAAVAAHHAADAAARTSVDASRSSLDGTASTSGSSGASTSGGSSDYDNSPSIGLGALAPSRSQRIDVSADSSARTLRLGGALDSNTVAAVPAGVTAVAGGLFTSRLSSRAGSPALGQSSSSDSTSAASTSSAVHHHIHHHYHHAHGSGSGSTSAAGSASASSSSICSGPQGAIANGPSSTSTTAPSSVTSSPRALGLSSVALGKTMSNSSTGSSSSKAGSSTGRKSKDWGRFLPPYAGFTNITSSTNGTTNGSGRRNESGEFIPDDGYFFADNGYHYRSGPLARKLGTAMLSREPSLSDLQALGNFGSASSSVAPSGANTPGGTPYIFPSSSSSAAAQVAAAASSRRRAGWKSPRRSGGNTVNPGMDGFLGTPSASEDFGIFDALTPTSGLLSTSSSSSPLPYRSRRRFSAFVPISAQKWWYRFLRHPLVPTQPLTILFALALFASFAFSVTTFMYHILSTDKAPRPWRQYCQEQRPFPHELADSLNPVDVFVGVFSVDAAYERRHLIRSTYLRHSRPIDPHTGKVGTNVQVKFILGRPRKHHARRIALEMETYNDIVVLDMKENMNQGKTHNFFKWASENATVPIYYKAPKGAKRIGALDPPARADEALTLGFKKADYVVKADDDSFLALSELERHLRVAPRANTYWGYLIRNLFMGGECYALSADLVNYVATSPALEAYTTGAEDKRVAKWMRMHPNASSINWITERCYIYDHPKAATTYSHGFLFPDEVERVRAEGQTGISTAERTRRGGELADAWSSVSKWKKAYVKPKKEMTIEEEVEALIEGGGRWTALDGWTNKMSSKDVVQWDSVVFENQDSRIMGGIEKTRKADEARTEYNLRSESVFGKYNRIPNSLLRDPGEMNIRPQHAKRSWEFWKRDVLSEAEQLEQATSPSPSASLPATSPVLESFANITNPAGGRQQQQEKSSEPALKGTADESGHYEAPRQPGAQYPIGSSPSFKKGFSFLPDAPANPDAIKQRAIPAPTLRYDPATMTLRDRRFLGLPYGGTVVVHYLKRNEWFLETALALLGRQNFWDTGLDAPAYPPAIPPSPAHDDDDNDGDRTGGPHYPSKDRVISPIPSWNGKGGQLEVVPAEWGSPRMYGSPFVKENGFVSLGRSVPWDALQRSEEGKYGKLRGSPRQRFVDQDPAHEPADEPADNDGKQKQEKPTGNAPSHLSTRSHQEEGTPSSMAGSQQSSPDSIPTSSEQRQPQEDVVSSIASPSVPGESSPPKDDGLRFQDGTPGGLQL